MKYAGIIFTLFVALLFTGCSDDFDTETTVDEIVVDDPSTSSGTLKNNDTNIDFIKEAYQALDKTEEFELHVRSTYGKIRWNKSIGVNRANEKFVYFIPIAFKDGNKTEAILIAKEKKNKIDFKIYSRKRIKKDIEKDLSRKPKNRKWGNLPVKAVVMSDSDLNLFGGTSLVFLEYLQAYEEDGSTKSTKSCDVVNICRHVCTHWFTAQDFWGCQQYAFRCFYYNFCDPDDNADPVGPGHDDNSEYNVGGGTGGNSSEGDNGGYADEPHPDDEAISIFLAKYNSKLTVNDKSFIKKNEWIVKYLEDYLENCSPNQDDGKPNLGVVGNMIRSFLDTRREEQFFERYWQGNGDWSIPQYMFHELKNIIESDIDNTHFTLVGNTTFNGISARKFTYRAYHTDYALALGTLTIYLDNSGELVGVEDTYDFDPHSGPIVDNIHIASIYTIVGCTDRSFKAEWQTRLTGFAGLIAGAKAYKIKYP